MKRFEGNDPVTHAMNEVLTRMSGCADPVCYACDNNRQAITELVKEIVKSLWERGEPSKPNPNCEACKRGDCFMNTDPLYPGYRPGDPSPPELCAAHNAKGNHHIVWNGDHNEILECGSERCNELTKRYPALPQRTLN